MQVSASGDNVVQAKAGKPQLILYFQTRIQMGDENYLYPALSLFAEVGGFMGLILGYSILNMAEFVVSTFEKYMLWEKWKKYTEDFILPVLPAESWVQPLEPP